MTWNLEKDFELYAASVQIKMTLAELNEIMGADIFAAIKGVSTSIDAVKKLSEMASKSKNIELREGILELREQLIESKDALLDVKEENSSLRAENVKLKKELEGKLPQLQFQNGLYYAPSDDIPFCPSCFDDQKKRIHLQLISNALKLPEYTCPVCKNVFKAI